MIRLVGVLWHDSNGPGDGLECATDNANLGYMNTRCVHALDTLIAEATAAGLWVILTARAKYGGSATQIYSYMCIYIHICLSIYLSIYLYSHPFCAPAAGWGWPGDPDVWHSDELTQKYYAMWTWVADRYSTWEPQ